MTENIKNRKITDCVKDKCIFWPVYLQANNEKISQFVAFMPTICDLYVCIEHVVFHLCRKNMKFNTCIFLSKNMQTCPVSHVQNNVVVMPHYENDIIAEPLSCTQSDSSSWKSILSEYNFSQCLQKYVSDNNLNCDARVLNSIIQRLFVLFIIYYRIDCKQSQYSDEIIFSNCKTRMYFIQELLSEHINSDYARVLRGGKVAEVKFLKHASRLISHDLMVDKSQLLQESVLTDVYVNRSMRKHVFKQRPQAQYWRDKMQMQTETQ